MASSGLEMNIFKLIVNNNYYAKIWPLIITFLPIYNMCKLKQYIHVLQK